MRFVFIGPPGVGKGTQARRLSTLRQIPHIATGDMLRDAIRSRSAAGLRAQSLMECGELVPDELVIDIVQKRLVQSDVRNGFILDGFPRTVAQAEALDAILEEEQVSLSKAFYFDAPDSVVAERISGRRTCKRCQANFHLKYLPPRSPGVCDHCSGELYQRTDDSEETVRGRLRAYQDQTRELIAYYSRRNLLVRIDADRPPDRIFEDLVEAAS